MGNEKKMNTQNAIAEGIDKEEQQQHQKPGMRETYNMLSLALVGIIVVSLFIYLFAAQKCLVFGHKWEAATCTTAKTCKVCATADGSPFGHKWEAATCTSAKTCTVCGAAEGTPIDHKWEAATCTNPKMCAVCGATEGAPVDHNWQAATCTSPKTCPVCGAVDGVALDHNWLEATCTTPKTCRECGEESGSALGHAWEEATYSSPQKCSSCGTTEGEPLVNPLIELIQDRLPIITYAMGSAGKVYGYQDEELTKKSDSLYLSAANDEIIILDISEDGSALKVRYPSKSADSRYRTLWFPLEDIISIEKINISYETTKQKTKTYRYSESENAIIRYGTMEAADKYIVLGKHESGYLVIMYEIFSKVLYDTDAGFKIALIEN